MYRAYLHLARTQGCHCWSPANTQPHWECKLWYNILHISIKVNCSTTGVPLVTQGYQYEQDTESIPDASTVRLTGQLGTQIPNAKNPSAPFGKAGWWGFILTLLFLLGVAGVIRSCKNRSVLDCAKQYLLSGINCQWRCPSRGTQIIDWFLLITIIISFHYLQLQMWLLLLVLWGTESCARADRAVLVQAHRGFLPRYRGFLSITGREPTPSVREWGLQPKIQW